MPVSEPETDMILSLAEWEWANRYWEFISEGEPEPLATGFDPERISEIKRVLRRYWRESNPFYGGSPA